MTDTKYEQLKKAIQKANPEIMELKFGCEITLKSSFDRETVQHKMVLQMSGEHVFFDNFSQIGKIRSRDIVEIIGRPIRLADVLLALRGKNYQKMFPVEDFGIRADCPAIWRSIWNLKDDNLDNQPEETKQFLCDLLVREKP